MADVRTKGAIYFEESPLARMLFSTTRFAWLWVIIRVWLGWQWIEASLHKISSPDWVRTGVALKGFWEHAIAVPAAPARPMISFEWYRSFLQYLLSIGAYSWFGKLVAYGELLVGIALVLGAFVGIAAFFGGVMNWNFMMAGSASTNPLLFVAAILVILAWRVAGYYGLDRVLLPALGTPWRPGKVFGTRGLPILA
ncbi:MAG TPA: DoxX family protein [bacterium]|nr:DoxX family protein [bacterium]